MRRFSVLFVSVFVLSLFLRAPLYGQDVPPKVLVFSKTAGFRHTSIPDGVAMVRRLGAAHGFGVDHTEDAAAFDDAVLAAYDAVVFLSTTGDVLDASQQAAFERYIRGGGAYVGIHAAADTEYEWPWYGGLVGAYFESHPAIQSATVVVNDRVHPSTDALPLRWTRTDEWYNYRRNPRGDVHVLLTLDEGSYGGGGGADGHDHPIAWCRRYDGGRSWYTGGGHTEASYTEPAFEAHVLGGLRWAVGAAAGDCDATVDASFEKVILDDDTDDPMELSVAPDGRVFFVERGGAIKIWRPDAGATVTAGRLAVHTGNEDGLLGITHDPDFARNGWIYLFYSPAAGEARQRLSRFTMAGDRLDTASEAVLLEVPVQRAECCHSAGSLAFGPDGNLFVSLGDNTNPFASDGYAPIDERPGRAAWDAQRSSGNTHDLRGKILRVTPQPDGTYTIPEGNLFDDPEAGRPEIYVMGNRNPFRIAVDAETGWLYWGEVGPDARSDNGTRGPRGYDEYNQARAAGNYGWPFCIADNRAYRDYDFAARRAGNAFDCTAGPVNDSPNNTGARQLPPAEAAWIWYPYDDTDLFPELNPGDGRTAMAGPTYHFDPSLPTPNRLPAYYDDTVFLYEWSRNWIREVKLDDDGRVLKINPFLESFDFRRPMDLEIGPDGVLYLIEWGTGFGGDNNDARVVRLDYVRGTYAPVAVAEADPTSGPLPLTVRFTGDASFHPDPAGTLTHAWDFDGDGTVDATTADAEHTYTTPGTYTAQLVVTDAAGARGVANVVVAAGNTRPVVTVVDPVEGGFFEWGEPIPFRVRVADAEDGATEDGTIDCARVVVQPGIGHDDHNHPLTSVEGCEGTFDAAPPGHGDDGANVFHVVTAAYTDAGAPGVGPLSGQATVMLQPKHKEAEHFTENGGVVFEAAGTTRYAARIDDGDYLAYAPVNLKGIDAVTFRVAAGGSGGRIELRVNAADGPLVGTTEVPGTGGWQAWQDVTAAVEDPGGTRTLYLVFRREPGAVFLFNLDRMVFDGEGVAAPVGAAHGPELPLSLSLGPVYPNPATGAAHVTYALPEAADVRLAVYDVLGRRVAVLVDGPQPAGTHTARFDAGAVASGLYVCRLTTPAGTVSRRLVVLR